MQDAPKGPDPVFPVRLQSLCKAASNEQDPEKLLEFVREINRLFDDNFKHITTAKKQDEG
jgi:hypothetical protein